jgi:hypothetical protein
MKLLVVSVVFACLVCGTAFASEEDILPPHRVSLAADAGKPFGEVSATLETTRDRQGRRLRSITLTVGGQSFSVPEEQFRDLQDPLIATAQLRTEAGPDRHPWLYLTFRLARPGAASVSDYPTVYLRFQDGQWRERSIRQPPPAEPATKGAVGPVGKATQQPAFPAATDATAKLLQDLGREDLFARAAAVDLLGRRKAAEAIPRLVDLLADDRALPGSDNWVGGHAAAALSQITGQPFSTDQQEWRGWWERHKKDFGHE